uniref:Perforin 1 n=1 Tax=Ornithorhynchus anatinus TaxID=9258 RepID=A0A6I8NPH2_ORNAN
MSLWEDKRLGLYSRAYVFGDPVSPPVLRTGLGTWLLVLALLPGLPPTGAQCRPAAAAACSAHQWVPGSGRAGQGLDVTTLSRSRAAPLEPGPGPGRPSGLPGPAACTLCPNPLLGGRLQRLPAAVAEWRLHGACARGEVASRVAWTVRQVAEAVAGAELDNDWAAELGSRRATGPLGAGAGLRSAAAEFAAGRAREDSYGFVLHEIVCPVYSFHLERGAGPSPALSQALSSLPPQYNLTSRGGYRSLIQTFGTHYATSVRLGGRVRLVTALRLCLATLDGVSPEALRACLSEEAREGWLQAQGAGNSSCRALPLGGFRGPFYGAYHESHEEAVGGSQRGVDGLLVPPVANDTDFAAWMKSLHSVPGVISSTVAPLHTLLDPRDPQREALRLAVTDYVAEESLDPGCPGGCPGGGAWSPREPCVCRCPGTESTDARCCSRRRGTARLRVTVVRAHGLRGDVFSATDAFVLVAFGDEVRRTATFLDRDSPAWHHAFDFGHVTLGPRGARLRVEVWDRDFFSADDLLGSCSHELDAEGSHEASCPLPRGRLEYRYSLVCGPHLGDPWCSAYVGRGR